MMFPEVAPVPGPAAPAAYAQAAKAKLKRDRDSYNAFRALDQAEHERAHERRVSAAVAAAESRVSLFRMDVEVLEAEAAEARGAFRAAEDRARDAREYARTQEAEAVRAREAGTAGEATDTQVRADTADGVAAEREAAAAEAREELGGLERDLGEARENLETTERGLRAARKAGEIPAGKASISEVTIRANASYMQRDEVWDTLSRQDKQRVQRLAEPRDIMSAQEWHAMMREALAIGGGAA